MNNLVLIGKKTGRIIIQDEEVIKFPTLDAIYTMVSNSNLSRLFLSDKQFISYLKDIIDGHYVIEDKYSALEEIFDAIQGESPDYDEDWTMDEKFSDNEFANLLIKNFSALYEIYSPTKTNKKGK